MQKTAPRKIQKGDVWLIENMGAVGHMQNTNARTVLAYALLWTHSGECEW